MINLRFYPILKPLCETNKKDNEPVTITTVVTSKGNGLMLNESRVSVIKSNIEGTTGTNSIKFVESIQGCFNSSSKTFKNLFRVAFAEETLLMVWDEISKKNLEESYNKNSNKVLFFKIKEMSTCLINSCYKFGVRKKMAIHVKNQSKQHLAIIMSPWDKIVMHSLYLVFKFIFDGLWQDKQLNITKNSGKIKAYHYLKPSFYSINSGATLGKSCHEVLRDVQTWYFCCWFIKININKNWDKINHNRLLNILRETIEDEPLLILLRQILNKEMFFKECSNQFDKSAEILQSNNLGVLLTNIYLNKLDQFVLERKKVNWNENCLNKNCNHIINKKVESPNILTHILEKNALDNQKYNFTKIFRQQKIKTAKWMGLSKVTFSKKIFRQIYYSRYIDSFLLGIRGPKFLAINALEETSLFIRCNLQLELQLAKIYHAKSNKTRYLGFDIKILNHAHTYKSMVKHTIARNKIKNELEQKKLRVKTREETFLNQIWNKKITKITDWIKYRIKPDKTMCQLTQKKLLNVLDDSTLKCINVFKSMKLSHPSKSVLNMIKKDKKKLLQKNISNNFKNLFQITLDNNSKKMNNTSNHIIYKTLYNYKHDAGPMLYAPKKLILKLMCDWGMINIISNKPIPNKMLFRYHDLNIILYYRSKATSILEYYKPAKNFYWIKKQVDHQMRHSLLFTLAKKHKTSTPKIIQAIGKNTSIYINDGSSKLKKVAAFLAPTVIHNKRGGFSAVFNCVPGTTKLKEPFIKTSIPKTLYHECQAKNCKKSNIKIYHLTALYKKISPNYVIASIKTHAIKMHETKIVEFALHKKQISLCTKHHLAIHTGKLFLEDLKTNYKSFKLLNFKGLGIKF